MEVEATAAGVGGSAVGVEFSRPSGAVVDVPFQVPLQGALVTLAKALKFGSQEMGS